MRPGLRCEGTEAAGRTDGTVDGVRRGAGRSTGAANFSVSDTGHLIFVAGPSSGISSMLDIAVMDPRTGAVEPLGLPPALYEMPRVSPKGERIAFGTDDGQEAIVWYHALSGTSRLQQLTSGGNNRYPVWASDTRISYQSDRRGAPAVFVQTIGGSEEQLTMPAPGTSHAPESWSRDGETLFYSVTAGSDVSLWTYSVRTGVRTVRRDPLVRSARRSVVARRTLGRLRCDGAHEDNAVHPRISGRWDQSPAVVEGVGLAKTAALVSRRKRAFLQSEADRLRDGSCHDASGAGLRQPGRNSEEAPGLVRPVRGPTTTSDRMAGW